MSHKDIDVNVIMESCQICWHCMLWQNATSRHIWRLLAKQLLSNCKKDCPQRCSFLKSCATCHQHRRPSNIIANGRIFIQRCGKGMMMMHYQTMTPNNLHGLRHQIYWKLSGYNKDKTSLQQQDSYPSELQQMQQVCSHVHYLLQVHG